MYCNMCSYSEIYSGIANNWDITVEECLSRNAGNQDFLDRSIYLCVGFNKIKYVKMCIENDWEYNANILSYALSQDAIEIADLLYECARKRSTFGMVGGEISKKAAEWLISKGYRFYLDVILAVVQADNLDAFIVIYERITPDDWIAWENIILEKCIHYNADKINSFLQPCLFLDR